MEPDNKGQDLNWFSEEPVDTFSSLCVVLPGKLITKRKMKPAPTLAVMITPLNMALMKICVEANNLHTYIIIILQMNSQI